MLLGAISHYSRAITILLLGLFLITYNDCHSNQCHHGTYRGTTSNSHAHSHGHGGACVWAEAKIQMADNTSLPIDQVEPGLLIISSSQKVLKVINKVCHDNGPFTLWEFDDKIPIVVTENHPVFINDTWYAGNPEDAYAHFGISCKRHGRPSTYQVKRVCSLELEGYQVSMYNANGLWVAD